MNQTPPRVSGWWLVVIMTIGAVLAFYGHWCFQAPSPISAQHSDFQFDKAWQHLETISGSGKPHPPGTAEHARVHQYLVDTLTDYGYQVSVQQSPPRSMWGQVNPLKNIVAIRPKNLAGQGRAEDGNVAGTKQYDWKSADPDVRKLLFVCHYDSHPNGPGAGDDGAAVASLLEVARLEANRPVGDRDIVFLFTDGEEVGLLGAEFWVTECPWLGSIDLVFNFEGRGTSGAAYLFETSRGDLNLIRNFSALARRPAGNSLAREVYRYMPNGTDFTVFISNTGYKGKPLSASMPEGNLSGQNFAFVGSVENYHTENDLPENLDVNSLWHHGQTAEALLNFYREGEIETSNQDAVYFDFAGRWLLWWPSHWNWGWLAVNAILLFACVFYCSIGSLRDLIFGCVASLILAVTMMLLIWITVVAFEQQHWFQPFWGRWVPGIGFGAALAAFWCMAIIGWSISGCLVECITKDKSLWVAVWSFWLIMTGVFVWLVPGGSFLFLIPVTAACVFRLIGHRATVGSRSDLLHQINAEATSTEDSGASVVTKVTGWQAEHPLFTTVLPCLVAWLIWFPIQRALLAGLAYRYPLLYVGLVPLLISPVIPLVTVVSFRSKLVLTSGATLCFGILVAFLLAT